MLNIDKNVMSYMQCIRYKYKIFYNNAYFRDKVKKFLQ